MNEINLYLRDSVEFVFGMDRNSVDLIVADPPFNLGKDYDGEIDDTRDDYYEWCFSWIGACFIALKPGGAFYLMTIQEHVGEMMIEMKKYGEFRNQIVWHNSSMPVKNRYCIGYQPILYYIKPGKPFVFNYGYEKRKSDAALPWGRENKGHSIKDIWDDIPFVSGGCMASKEAVLESDSKKKAHPAQMPIRLASRIINYSSNNGDLVLDPFMGSGTVGVACVQTERNYIGIEMVQKYYDLASKRIGDEIKQMKMF